MLVNLKRPPEQHQDTRRLGRLGLVLAGLVLAQFVAISTYNASGTSSVPVDDGVVGNVERVGMLLYTNYLIPFEVASILLLVAMVGAIVLAKREL